MDVFYRAKKFLFDLISENVKPKFIEILREKRIVGDLNDKLFHTNVIENKQLELYSDKERIDADLDYRINLEMLPENTSINNNLEKRTKLATWTLGKTEEEKKTFSKSEEDETRILNEKRESDFSSYLNLNNEAKLFLLNKANYDINKVDVYDRKEIEALIEDLDLSHLEKPPYSGFNSSEKIKRILIVSHSGFISELINVIKQINDIKLHSKHHTINTGLYVIRIFCKKCGITTKCKNEISDCKDFEFDFVLENDVTHLSCLK